MIATVSVFSGITAYVKSLLHRHSRKRPTPDVDKHATGNGIAGVPRMCIPFSASHDLLERVSMSVP
jgi:hypothetical protein